MRRIREVIVVEGRYDKNALKQVVEATVVETGGFGVFNDRERLALLRRLAAEAETASPSRRTSSFRATPTRTCLRKRCGGPRRSSRHGTSR